MKDIKVVQDIILELIAVNNLEYLNLNWLSSADQVNRNKQERLQEAFNILSGVQQRLPKFEWKSQPDDRVRKHAKYYELMDYKSENPLSKDIKDSKEEIIINAITFFGQYLVQHYECNFPGGENAIQLICVDVFEKYKKLNTTQQD